jgi:hypothetical protein
MWGGPPGPRPTPPSASVFSVLEKPDQGVRRGRGRPPHHETGREILSAILGNLDTLPLFADPDDSTARRNHDRKTGVLLTIDLDGASLDLALRVGARIR